MLKAAEQYLRAVIQTELAIHAKGLSPALSNKSMPLKPDGTFLGVRRLLDLSLITHPHAVHHSASGSNSSPSGTGLGRVCLPPGVKSSYMFIVD